MLPRVAQPSCTICSSSRTSGHHRDTVRAINDGVAFVVHAELQTKHGILNHENLIFDELIADKKYQFVYCFTPAPIKGATGSNGCPIAIT